VIDIITFSRNLADLRDVPFQEMLEIVETHAGQISDDLDLYDAETGQLTDAGEQLLRDQIIDEAPNATREVLDELRSAQGAVDAAEENLARRDAAIRKALSEGTPVREIVEITELSRQRVYQIRDGVR
jgi:hypothetical protein